MCYNHAQKMEDQSLRHGKSGIPSSSHEWLVVGGYRNNAHCILISFQQTNDNCPYRAQLFILVYKI